MTSQHLSNCAKLVTGEGCTCGADTGRTETQVRATINLVRQADCVKRELAMRGRVYPKRVADGKMRQAQADEEVQVMQAVLQTVQDHAAVVDALRGLALAVLNLERSGARIASTAAETDAWTKVDEARRSAYGILVAHGLINAPGQPIVPGAFPGAR